MVRPLLGLLAVGVVIGVVVGVALWLVRGGDEPTVAVSPSPAATGQVAAGATPPGRATAAAPTAPATRPPTPMPSPTPEPTPTPTPSPTPVPQETEELPDPVPVQVLDAGGGDTRVDEVVATLEDLDYEIAAVNDVRRRVEETTVLWNDNHQSDAFALMERDERFAREQKNDQYAQSVPLHVLVGPDWE